MSSNGDRNHRDWGRLGRLVRERREDLGLTQAEVHAVGGPSPATLYLIESGQRDSYRPRVLRALERAIQWRATSVQRVLAGGHPEPDGDGPRPLRTYEIPMQRPGPKEWAAGFRELPAPPREKLLVLCQLMEETVAELDAGAT